MRFTHNGKPVTTISTTKTADGAVVEFQARGRDFWVTEANGNKQQCLLAATETKDPEHGWWQAVREARRTSR
jgi:hypothetical protein